MDALLQFLASEALSLVPLDNLPPGTPETVVCLPTPSIQTVTSIADSGRVRVTDSHDTCVYEQEIEGDVSFLVQLAASSHHKTTLIHHVLSSCPDLSSHVVELLTNATVLESCMPVVWGTEFISVVPKSCANPTVLRAAVVVSCNQCPQLRIRAAEEKTWVMPEWTEEELETESVAKPKVVKQDRKSKQRREERVVRGWARVWRARRFQYAKSMQAASQTCDVATSFLAQRFVHAEMSVPMQRCVLIVLCCQCIN